MCCIHAALLTVMLHESILAFSLFPQACDDVLEAPRFGCEAPQDFVEQVAMDMGVPLSSYLKYV